jgi:integrase
LDSNSDLRYANSGSKDPLPEILTDDQDRTLVAFLQSSVPQGESSVSLSRDGLWQVFRNRTGVALQRGAGLTPLEIRMLTVSSVFVDSDPAKGPWKVRAPATGSVQAHDAPVARWARPLLTRWMQLRSELGIPGEWLFPSTKSGKQWGKTAHFDSVAEVLDAAGLVGFKGGSYRLRHTFAMRQLARVQNTEAQVATWLGIDVGEMKRYRGPMMVPVDVE